MQWTGRADCAAAACGHVPGNRCPCIRGDGADALAVYDDGAFGGGAWRGWLDVGVLACRLDLAEVAAPDGPGPLHFGVSTVKDAMDEATRARFRCKSAAKRIERMRWCGEYWDPLLPSGLHLVKIFGQDGVRGSIAGESRRHNDNGLEGKYVLQPRRAVARVS